MEAIAKTKYLKGSPRKARLVVDLVRGKNVSQALAILKFTNKRAADPVAKCIRSAVANATYSAEQQNIAIDPDDLWIKTCYVDMGPTKSRKRLRPAPQGRAYQERRHYCHITIELTSDVPVEEVSEKPKKLGKKATAKAEAEAAKSKAGKTTEKAKDEVKKEAKEAAPKKEETAAPEPKAEKAEKAEKVEAAAEEKAADVKDESPAETKDNGSSEEE
ncbi:MAG: 50S ribosomal protein L22 [Acidobacteria bacterium]|nr:50S ribosomal protein L22 [Acidobacteriota bacterium]